MNSPSTGNTVTVNHRIGACSGSSSKGAIADLNCPKLKIFNMLTKRANLPNMSETRVLTLKHCYKIVRKV